ncbi:MAG: HlyD family secretion protein [Planctomycetota bacterium]|jgi:multidrug resistance efflux pump
MADGMPRIRTPLGQHWRRVRYQLLPVLAFAAAVLGTGWLWRRQASFPNAVGEVEAVQIPVRSQYPVYLSELTEPVARFDRVDKDVVVARLEDTAAESALEALTDDVAALRAEVEATRARLIQERAERGYDRLLEGRRLALDVERTELTVIDLETQVEAEKANLARYSTLLAQAEELKRTGGGSLQTVVDLTLQRDQSDALIRGTSQGIAQANLNLQAARERLKAHPESNPETFDAYLEPFRQRRAAQQKRVQEIRLRLAAMTLRAPASGTICAILRHPGQTVQAGEDILLIAPDRQAHIVAYVREHQRLRPEVGMEVVVRSRASRGRSGQAKVIKVGPQFEEVPPHQRSDPARLEWGLPVLISMPSDVPLRPGELVDIVFGSG